MNREHFQKVWWDGMENLIKSYPIMYQVWFTKHVLGYCGTNKQMSYGKSGCSVMCLSYRSDAERTPHVTRCRELGRKKMLHSLIGELVDWVYETMDDYDMTMSLSKHLMFQGKLTFEDAGSQPNSAPEDSYDWI